MKDLTHEDRVALASDPKMVAFAISLARKKTKHQQWLRQDLEGEAVAELWFAALTYDPSKGADFKSYCFHKINCCMKDWIRKWNHYSCRHKKKVGMLVSFSQFGSTNNMNSIQEILTNIPSSDKEIGWELEQIDFVKSYTRDLHGVAKKCVEAVHLRLDDVRQFEVFSTIGMKEAAFRLGYLRGLRQLREMRETRKEEVA